MALISWMKQNKLTSILLVIVGYFILQYFTGISTRNLTPLSMSEGASGVSNSSYGTTGLGKVGAPATDIAQRSSMIFPPVEPDYAPNADEKNRLVVSESYLSLLVKDVVDVRNKIVKYASENGGYMVNANTNNPQDAPTSTVIVRVPSSKMDETLSFYRALGVKVVNENFVGTDVTDQYVDINARIEQLEKTKAKLEEILDRATAISDITNLTQQILSYQSQIDSYKGQQDALKKNADLAKLTIYLSTDEIALPYTPSETFRPSVIFKLAVRSLVTTLRGFAENLIWLGVYSIIWIPALLIFIFIRKWWLRKNKSESLTSLKN
jgi:hypothetical protein